MIDYRIDAERAAGMTSRQIVDEVLFKIADNAPSYADDEEMTVLLQQLNPVVAAVFSAWMATGFIVNGGLFAILDTCCSEMVARAAHGYRLLGKEDIAYAVELSARAFPMGIIPSSDESRSEMLEERSERLEADKETPVDESLAGLSYAFNLTDVYDCTDRLVERFRYEFVKP
jgi:hypothetical protein